MKKAARIKQLFYLYWQIIDVTDCVVNKVTYCDNYSLLLEIPELKVVGFLFLNGNCGQLCSLKYKCILKYD